MRGPVCVVMLLRVLLFPDSDSDSHRGGVSESLRESTTKRNETEPNETPPREEEKKGHFPESVSDDLVLAFAKEFPGEPSSGAPPMPRRFVEEWLLQINGRREWPGNWKRLLLAAWRVRFRTWLESGEKNGGGALLGTSPSVTRPQRRFLLNQEKDRLMEEWAALHSVGADTRPLDPAIEAVKRELEKLEA